MNNFPMTQNLSDNGVNFDRNHYWEVCSARKEEPEHSIKVEEIPGFIIKKNTPIYDTENRRYVHVQNIYKHWHRGWYYCIIYYAFYKYMGKIKKTHGEICISNINCHNLIVLEEIEKNKERYNFASLKRI